MTEFFAIYIPKMLSRPSFSYSNLYFSARPLHENFLQKRFGGRRSWLKRLISVNSGEGVVLVKSCVNLPMTISRLNQFIEACLVVKERGGEKLKKWFSKKKKNKMRVKSKIRLKKKSKKKVTDSASENYVRKINLVCLCY